MPSSCKAVAAASHRAWRPPSPASRLVSVCSSVCPHGRGVRQGGVGGMCRGGNCSHGQKGPHYHHHHHHHHNHLHHHHHHHHPRPRQCRAADVVVAVVDDDGDVVADGGDGPGSPHGCRWSRLSQRRRAEAVAGRWQGKYDSKTQPTRRFFLSVLGWGWGWGWDLSRYQSPYVCFCPVVSQFLSASQYLSACLFWLSCRQVFLFSSCRLHHG